MSRQPHPVDCPGWRQLLSQVEQLMTQPTASAQCEFILGSAARLLGSTASLWLSESLHHLLDPGERPPFSTVPPSELMRRARDARRNLRSETADLGTNPALAAPLVFGDTLIGVLQVERTESVPFDDTEIELFDCYAAQVALALQATRCAATESLRSEQLSLLRLIGDQVANGRDQDVLFDEVVELIHQRLGYSYVHIFSIDLASRRVVCRASSLRRELAAQEQELAYDLEESGGIIPWVATHGETVLANDVVHNSHYRASKSLPSDVKAELAVPLVFGGRVLGVLDIQSDRLSAFGGDDLSLAETVADSMAIALHTASLCRSEQWRRQATESLQQVAGSLSADIALEQLLDIILIELQSTLPSDAAAIWLLHNDDLRLNAVRGYGTAGCTSDFSPQVDAWLNQALTANQPMIRAAESPPDPLGSDLGFAPGHSAIAAPLSVGEHRLGLLTSVHHTPEQYGAGYQAMIGAFASNAAVAIQNTRLYREAQEQAYASTVLLKVAEATRSLTSLDQILETVVRLFPMLVGVERCAVLLWNESTEAFTPAVANGLNQTQLATFNEWQIALGDVPAFDRMHRNHRPLLAPDVVSDPQLESTVVSSLGFGSPALFPLLARGEVIGAILVDYRGNWPEYDQSKERGGQRIEIMQGIAYQTAAAIENTRLLEEQQEEAYVSAVLLEVARAVASFNDLDDVLSAVTRLLPIMIGVEKCIIFLREEKDDGQGPAFHPTSAFGIPRDVWGTLRGRRYFAGDFPLLDTAAERNTLVFYPLESSLATLNKLESAIPPGFPVERLEDAQSSARSLLSVPLSVREDALGVMLLEEVETSSSLSERRLEIISGIARQVALAVQNDQLQKERAGHERLERELQLAREIQQTFMPDVLPDLPGWELSFTWRAARQVAGDLYDFFVLPGGRLGLVIADVVDKGIPAALFMTVTRALVRAAALEELSPAAALMRVNDLLSPDAPHGMFVTIFYAIVSLETGSLTYANAGHNPPVLLRSRTGALERLTKGGMALGVLENTPLEERPVSLSVDDSLILYTDGVTEAFSPEGEIYGEDRLHRTIQAAAGSSAQEMLDRIDESVITFAGTASPSDDLTLMVLHRLSLSPET